MESVIDYMEKFINEDPKLKKYQEQYGSLIEFSNDFYWLNVQREEQLVLPPIEELLYSDLNQLSKDVGGELLVTPLKKYTVIVPYGLHKEVKKKADLYEKTTEQYLHDILFIAIKEDTIGE